MLFLWDEIYIGNDMQKCNRICDTLRSAKIKCKLKVDSVHSRMADRTAYGGNPLIANGGGKQPQTTYTISVKHTDQERALQVIGKIS